MFGIPMVFLKDLFQKVDLKINQQTTKSMKNYPVCNGSIKEQTRVEDEVEFERQSKFLGELGFGEFVMAGEDAVALIRIVEKSCGVPTAVKVKIEYDD